MLSSSPLSVRPESTERVLLPEAHCKHIHNEVGIGLFRRWCQKARRSGARECVQETALAGQAPALPLFHPEKAAGL